MDGLLRVPETQLALLILMTSYREMSVQNPYGTLLGISEFWVVQVARRCLGVAHTI